MILDVSNLFSDGQDETSQGACVSDYTVDLVNSGDAEKALWFEITVDTTCSSGGSATVAFALQTCAESTFSSATTLWTRTAVAVATLVAGYKVVKMRLPAGCLRYLRVVYTIATADLVSGKFNAFLTHDVQTNNGD